MSAASTAAVKPTNDAGMLRASQIQPPKLHLLRFETDLLYNLLYDKSTTNSKSKKIHTSCRPQDSILHRLSNRPRPTTKRLQHPNISRCCTACSWPTTRCPTDPQQNEVVEFGSGSSSLLTRPPTYSTCTGSFLV